MPISREFASPDEHADSVPPLLLEIAGAHDVVETPQMCLLRAELAAIALSHSSQAHELHERYLQILDTPVYNPELYDNPTRHAVRRGRTALTVLAYYSAANYSVAWRELAWLVGDLKLIGDDDVSLAHARTSRKHLEQLLVKQYTEAAPGNSQFRIID